MKNLYKPLIIFAVIISIGILTGFSINHRDKSPSRNNSNVVQKNENIFDISNNSNENSRLKTFRENSTFIEMNLLPDTCSFEFTSHTSGTTNQLLTVSTVSASVAWAAGVGPTVIRTIDGSTWTNSTGTGITGDIYNIYGIDANNALCTTSPSATFIYRTSNGGVTWSQVFTQAGGFIDAIQMTSFTEGYALGDPVTSKWTVLKTTDAGNSWARMATEPTQVGSEAGWNNCFQILGTNMWFGTNSTKVYHSSNSGLTWSSSPTTGVVSTYSLNFNSLINGLAGGTAMVKTTDGGNSYSSTSSPGISSNINGLEGSGNNWWSISTDASVYRSSNNGANWYAAYTRPGAVFRDIDFYVIDPCPKGWIVGDSGKVTKMSSTSITVIENDCGAVVDDRPMYLVDSIPKSPKATVKNFGTLNQTNVPITFKLNGPINYTSTKLVNVNSGDSVQVSFDSTFNPLDTGTYSVTIYTSLVTDQNRSNDTVRGITAAYKPNGGYGDMPCRYYYANSIAEAKYESRPVYCWENPTCYFPLITNGVDVSGGRYVGDPNLDDGYFKLKLRNLLFNCGADTSLKIKMCGAYFDSLFIGTNGLVSFTLKNGQHNEFHVWPILPTSPTQNYSIYPLWMDLIFKPGSTLTYGIVGKKLIITYSKVTDFANQSKFVSFQVAYELVNNPSAIEPNIRFTYGNAPTQTSNGFVFGTGNFPFPLVGLYATNFLHYKMPFNRPVMNGNSGLAVEFGPSPFTLNKLGCDPCICDGNILQNGNFANYTIGNGNLFPIYGGTAHADPWYSATNTPQLGSHGGCCDSGFIRFWGEKETGERIYQNVNILRNHRYQISMCIRKTPGDTLTETYGRIGVIFSNGPVTNWIPNTNRYNGRIIGGAMPGEGLNAYTTPTISPPGITSTSWTTYTYTWDAAANYSTININPLNNNYGGPKTISWMDIDNVCIKDLGQSPLKIIFDVDFLSEAMKITPDVVTVTLRSSTSPFPVVDADTLISIADSPRVCVRLFTENVTLGSSYYVVLNHRNSIETWSANPVMITGDTTTKYDFTTSLSKAYGNNMVLVGGLASIFSGDVNQDGLIDISDIVSCYNASATFLTGYVDTDLNGDGLVDIGDIVVAYNNSVKFIQVMRP